MLGGLGRIMPTHDDARVRAFGTRVRLFPQAPFLPGFGEPEVVWLSPPAGAVLPGPADDAPHFLPTMVRARALRICWRNRVRRPGRRSARCGWRRAGPRGTRRRD